jgi:hypothetical protein
MTNSQLKLLLANVYVFITQDKESGKIRFQVNLQYLNADSPIDFNQVHSFNVFVVVSLNALLKVFSQIDVTVLGIFNSHSNEPIPSKALFHIIVKFSVLLKSNLVNLFQ